LVFLRDETLAPSSSFLKFTKNQWKKKELFPVIKIEQGRKSDCQLFF
jgi:hypothetical protein